MVSYVNITRRGGVAHMVEVRILVVFSNINSLYLPKRSIRTFDSQACEESLSSFRQVRRSIL